MSEDIRNYTTCDVIKFPGRALGPCAHHDSEQNRLTGRQAEQSRSVHKYSKSKQQIGLDKLQIFASFVWFRLKLFYPSLLSRESTLNDPGSRPWPHLTLNWPLISVDFVRDAKLGESLCDWSSGASRIGQKDTKKFKSYLVHRFCRKKRTRTQAYKVINHLIGRPIRIELRV